MMLRAAIVSKMVVIISKNKKQATTAAIIQNEDCFNLFKFKQGSKKYKNEKKHCALNKQTLVSNAQHAVVRSIHLNPKPILTMHAAMRA